LLQHNFIFIFSSISDGSVDTDAWIPVVVVGGVLVIIMCVISQRCQKRNIRPEQEANEAAYNSGLQSVKTMPKGPPPYSSVVTTAPRHQHPAVAPATQHHQIAVLSALRHPNTAVTSAPRYPNIAVPPSPPPYSSMVFTIQLQGNSHPCGCSSEEYECTRFKGFKWIGKGLYEAE